MQYQNHGFIGDFGAWMNRIDTSRRTRYPTLDALAIVVTGSTAYGFLLLNFSQTSIAMVVLTMLCVGYLGLRLRHREAKAATTDGLSRILLSTDEKCLKLLDCDGRIACISEVGQRLMRAQSADQQLGKNWLGFWSTPEAGRIQSGNERPTCDLFWLL